MNAHRLLFSRSHSKDYRWIFSSKFLSNENKALLDLIFDNYKGNYKRLFSQYEITPVHFLEFENAYVVIECVKTNSVDKDGRAIYALQGLCVAKTYKRHIWFALPWLMTSHKHLLDSWGTYSYGELNKIQTSIEITTEIDLNSFEKLPSMLTNSSEISLNLHSVMLDFSVEAYMQLVNLISGDTLPFQFIFGGTEQLYSSIGIPNLRQELRKETVITDNRSIKKDVPSYILKTVMFPLGIVRKVIAPKKSDFSK